MDEEVKGGCLIVTGLALVGALFSACGSLRTVNSGERGVRVTLGKVSDEQPVQPGLNFKLPLVQDIECYSIRTRKLAIETTAFTKDVQSVQLKSALNYHLDPNAVVKIYKEYGHDIEKLVIIPTVLDVIKNDLGRREAVKLVENRDDSSENIEATLKKELEKKYVIVQDFRYEDIDFSDAFEKAIEKKVIAEQETLTQQHISEQEKKKKDQAITRAEAEAEHAKLMARAEAEAITARAEAEANALRVKGQALRENPEVLQLQGISRWNGELPRVIQSGNSGSIIDLGAILSPKKVETKIIPAPVMQQQNERAE